MKKSALIIRIGIAVLLLAAVFYFYFSNQSKHNWIENYKIGSKEPYGCYVIAEMLKSQTDSKFSTLKNSGSSSLPSMRSKDVTYIFIGENLFLSDSEQDSLIRFASQGNHLFIASKQVPSKLLDTIFNLSGCQQEPVEVEFSENFTIHETFNFYSDDLYLKDGYKYTFEVKNKPVEYNWQFIDGGYFCDSTKNLYWISYAGDHYVNCVTGGLGEGSITIHTNPVMFTNIMMKPESHFEYADKIFSHIPLHTIIWDETSKFPYSGKDDPSSSSPLKYILSQPALRAGWYTLLILSVLYVLFRAKRKVRVIPVIEPKVNNSMAFLKSVSRLFLNAGDHRKMAEMKMKYFLAFLRDKYNYNADSMNRPDFHEALSLRSGVDKALIQTIFAEYKIIHEMNDITSFRLEDFNKLIHLFYVRCR